MEAAGDLSSPVPREKALYSELPQPTRIGHSIGHQVQKLLADGNSKLAIIRIAVYRAAAHPRGSRKRDVDAPLLHIA